jgi:hypothetical protein
MLKALFVLWSAIPKSALKSNTSPTFTLIAGVGIVPSSVAGGGVTGVVSLSLVEGGVTGVVSLSLEVGGVTGSVSLSEELPTGSVSEPVLSGVVASGVVSPFELPSVVFEPPPLVQAAKLKSITAVRSNAKIFFAMVFSPFCLC